MDTKKRAARLGIKKENKALAGTVAYRLKCAKTANGLSHFVMYGDVKNDKALL